MLSWAVQRDIFYTERDRIRKEFEANLHLKDLGVVEKCIADGEAKLAEYAHPDPYTVPTAYGGASTRETPRRTRTSRWSWTSGGTSTPSRSS